MKNYYILPLLKEIVFSLASKDVNNIIFEKIKKKNIFLYIPPLNKIFSHKYKNGI